MVSLPRRTRADRPAEGRETALAARIVELEAALAAQWQLADDLKRGEALALLDALYATAPIGLAFVDPQLRYVRINQLLAEMGGLPADAYPGRTNGEILPQIAPAVEPLLRQVLATGEAIIDVTIRGTTPAAPDSLREWQASYYPVPGRDGAVVGVGIVAMETTERTRAEDALRERTTWLELASDAAEIGTWRRDLATGRMQLDARARAHYGFSSEEATFAGLLAHIHPDDRARLTRCAAALLDPEGDGRCVDEYRVVDPDGATRWLVVHTRVLLDDQRRPVMAVGTSRDITADKLVEQELRARTDQLQALSRRLVEAHERERRAIGRELHDEVGQVLTGLKLSLSAALSAAPPRLAGLLVDAQASIAELTTRVRSLSLDLRPALLDDLGLLPALDWYLARYTSRTGTQVELRHQGVERRFPPEVETVAYRTVQEALTNVARHAGAPKATVRLLADHDRLMLRVDDEGRGFDAEAVMRARATGGLSGMEERVRLIGGCLSIESAPGEGTRIIAELPLWAGEQAP